MAHRDNSRLDVDHAQPSFSGAASHPTVPRNLIIAEQPKAVWTSQKGPERLFEGVEVEGRGREQQPRTKLMMLANELDAEPSSIASKLTL